MENSKTKSLDIGIFSTFHVAKILIFVKIWKEIIKEMVSS